MPLDSPISTAPTIASGEFRHMPRTSSRASSSGLGEADDETAVGISASVHSIAAATKNTVPVTSPSASESWPRVLAARITIV